MKALMIAFSMYSRIPMPAGLWEEKDRKRAMCFFPLIGAVVGALFYGAFRLLEYKGAGTVLSAAILTAVPFFVTGGIHMDGFLAAAAGFILSRALSGFGAAVFPEARAHGMLSDFMKDVHKKQVAVVMAAFGAFAACLMVKIGGRYGILAVLSAVAVFIYYRRMVFMEFSGITGDLAGYFLQLCELSMVLSMVIGGYFI